MNKLEILFNNKQSDILSIYFTGGYPNLDDTSNIITELEKSKVDLIEIGIPFSDPVADGPVIQYSNSASIENGMNLKLLLDQLGKVKNESKIRKILMGYFNPILQLGVEDFCRACNEVGVDGVIVPDLPLMEYELKYGAIFRQFGIHFIFLVSPQTSEIRLQEIDQLSTCFIYAVSTNSTTGGAVDFSAQKDYFSRLKKNLKNPFLIGFGVKDKETFKSACEYANGAIIGSSFIQAISESGELNSQIRQFIQGIKN